MKEYKGLSALLADRGNFPNSGRLYIEKAKLRDMQNARYWLLTRKEIKGQGYGKDASSRIPVSLRDRDVEHFMGIWTFEYIIDHKMGNTPGLSSAGAIMFVEAALMHYLQNSRFMD